MARTINIELSEKSIAAAIRDLELYADGIDSKVEKFIEKLKGIGVEVAQYSVSSLSPEEKGSTGVSVQDIPNGVEIILSGNKALLVEFGAGITYSSPQHPKAGEMNMGVGTYPNQTHAFDPNGWWYAHGKHSYGNPAYMPLYKAGTEVRRQIHSIAREVFRS